MPIGYLSLWVQPRSLTSGDLSWPWNFSGTMSRVTSSHVFTSISSTIPITVNRTTPSCVYSRFRWNLVEGCSSYDVITSWPDLTRPNFFHQKLRKRCPISYGKFQRDSPNGVASSSEKLMGGVASTPPPDRARVKGPPHTLVNFSKRHANLTFGGSGSRDRRPCHRRGRESCWTLRLGPGSRPCRHFYKYGGRARYPDKGSPLCIQISVPRQRGRKRRFIHSFGKMYCKFSKTKIQDHN